MERKEVLALKQQKTISLTLATLQYHRANSGEMLLTFLAVQVPRETRGVVRGAGDELYQTWISNSAGRAYTSLRITLPGGGRQGIQARLSVFWDPRSGRSLLTLLLKDEHVR